MKALIFPGYGSSYYTPAMRKAMKQDKSKQFIHGRIGKVVEVVEAAEVRNGHSFEYQDWQDFLKELEQKEGTIIGVEMTLADGRKVIKYFTWNPESRWSCEMEIIDVDTSRVWRIGEYDGAEGIEYFSEPEILDKELNYGRW